MIDISTESVLKDYLLSKGIIDPNENNRFHYCSGGVSCTVVFVYAGKKQMIIKQGLAQLKTKEVWLCDPNRMNIEQRSNQIYHEIMPDCAPEVYFYDAENYIYGREALPEDWRMWKEDLLAGILSFPTAEKIITTLLKVHSDCSKRKEIAQEFDDNEIFYNLRISPYFEFTLQKYPQLKPFAVPLIQMLMNEKITLIHGDFSPKNILTDGNKVSILDYEVAHYGHPSFDLAFFSTHFVLKAVKNKAYAVSYLNMLGYMMNIYFSGCDYMDKKTLERGYIQLLALMILARVDGKSPAEYITKEHDKELLRSFALEIVNCKLETIDSVMDMIKNKIEQA